MKVKKIEEEKKNWAIWSFPASKNKVKGEKYPRNDFKSYENYYLNVV